MILVFISLDPGSVFGSPESFKKLVGSDDEDDLIASSQSSARSRRESYAE